MNLQYSPLSFERAGRVPNLGGLRVLLVEDEPIVALDIEMALEDVGAHVVGPASSVGAALALLERAAKLDAAILDVNLQGTEVFPVAERLFARHVPIVFHTAYGARSDFGLRFPGSRVRSKPSPSLALLSDIAALAAQRRH